MHYQEATVLWTYHRTKQTKYNPTLKEIEEWDERLWKRFDQHLVPKMTAFASVVIRSHPFFARVLRSGS